MTAAYVITLAGIVHKAPVPGFPGYRATSDGHIESCRRFGMAQDFGPWRTLVGTPGPNGYLSVSLKRDGVRHGKRVHRLVALALIPNPDDLPVVRHLNGDRVDNRMENLAWGTVRDNEQDKRRHGTYFNTNSCVALADDQVAIVFAMRDGGLTLERIANEFDVSVRTVARVLQGKSRGRK